MESIEKRLMAVSQKITTIGAVPNADIVAPDTGGGGGSGITPPGERIVFAGPRGHLVGDGLRTISTRGSPTVATYLAEQLHLRDDHRISPPHSQVSSATEGFLPFACRDQSMWRFLLAL